MNPNYYAVIPASVRYDENLTPNSKLLYGEITALCNKEGYCWATNGYFAELYKTSEKTISRWIKNLEDNKYIETMIETFRYNDGTIKKVRYIYLDKSVLDHMDKNVLDHADKSVQDHVDENVSYNIKDNNNTLTNITNSKGAERFVPPTVEEVRAYCEERENDIDAEYFIDYYETRGWKLKGGDKMKSWKAAIRTWEKRDFGNSGAKTEKKAPTKKYWWEEED